MCTGQDEYLGILKYPVSPLDLEISINNLSTGETKGVNRKENIQYLYNICLKGLEASNTVLLQPTLTLKAISPYAKPVKPVWPQELT